MNNRVEKSLLLIISGIFLGAIFLIINNIEKIIVSPLLITISIVGILGIAIVSTLALLPFANQERLANKIKKEQNEK